MASLKESEIRASFVADPEALRSGKAKIRKSHVRGKRLKQLQGRLPADDTPLPPTAYMPKPARYKARLRPLRHRDIANVELVSSAELAEVLELIVGVSATQARLDDLAARWTIPLSCDMEGGAA
jgi:hypothetical protein